MNCRGQPAIGFVLGSINLPHRMGVTVNAPGSGRYRETMTQNEGNPFEQWCSTALLVAGGLFGLDTMFMALDLFTVVALSGGVFVVVFVSALILTLTGVLGFYPALSESRPRLARLSMAPVAGAGVLLVVTFGWAITASLLDRSLPPGGLAALIISLLFFGLLLVGVASARVQAPSRIAGVFVLGLVAVWGGWFTGIVIWGPHHLPSWWSPLFSAATSVTTLALGYTIHRTLNPPIRSIPTEL